MAMSSSVFSSRSVRRSSALALALVALAACDIDEILNKDDPTFHVQFLNLVTDSPALEYSVDGTDISSATYQTSTSLHAVRAGQHRIDLGAVRPPDLRTDDDDDDDEDDTIPVNASLERNFDADINYTIIAYGTLDNTQMLVIDDAGERDEIEDDHIVWRIVHVAPDIPSMDVFLTAPEAQIHSPQHVATLNFGDQSGEMSLKLFPRSDALDEDEPLRVNLTIELRVPGTGERLYRSPKIQVTEQGRAKLLIVPSIAPGPARVALMHLAATGAMLDPDDDATMRFVHLSPDSPAVDVIPGSSFLPPLAQNVGFRDASPRQRVRNGDVDLIGTPAGNPGAFVFLEEHDTAPGGAYSLYAFGPLADLETLVLTDERRTVPTQARFRLLHAAASLEEHDGFDVYLTLPGQVLDFNSDDDDDDTDAASRFRRFTNFGYRSSTAYVTLAEGNYELHFAATGTSRIEIARVPLQLANGHISTIVLHDSGTGELEFLAVEDGPGSEP